MLGPTLVETLIDEGPVEHVLDLARVANADLANLGQQALLEFLVNRGIDDQVARTRATLATSTKGREDRPLHRIVQVGVAHDDERVLAAQLKSGVLQVTTGNRANLTSPRSRTGKGHLVHEALVHHLD